MLYVLIGAAIGAGAVLYVFWRMTRGGGGGKLSDEELERLADGEDA